MRNNITLNHENKTIVITKEFNKKSCKYKSEEYMTLIDVQKDFPSYKIVVRKSYPRRNDPFSGLSFQHMEKYIMEHDKDGSIMNEYYNLRAVTDEAKELNLSSKSYHEIKQWFLNKFPEVTDFQKQIDSFLVA